VSTLFLGFWKKETFSFSIEFSFAVLAGAGFFSFTKDGHNDARLRRDMRKNKRSASREHKNTLFLKHTNTTFIYKKHAR
jgi:hypothetical protein